MPANDILTHPSGAYDMPAAQGNPPVRFTKMHGLGNSYIYIDRVRQPALDLDWAALARRLSDVRFGIGSDGLILIDRGVTHPLAMRMFNADGSEGEMCGNGIRCVARYAYDSGLVGERRFGVETKAGPRQLWLVGDEESPASWVRVDMGEARLLRGAIPMGGNPAEQAIGAPLTVGETSYAVTAVSMGNPHCVLFVPDVEAAPVEQLGPAIEHHPLFPERANVEFIEVISPRALKMRVWERGSQETWACGTGACAAAVAAALGGYAERRVTVELRGGPLDIEWARDGRVFMTGPTAVVCTGELDQAFLSPRTAAAGRPGVWGG